MSEMDPGESERKSELISFLLESLSEMDDGDREATTLMALLLDRLNTSEMDLQYRKGTQALLTQLLNRLQIFGRDSDNSERRSLILSKYLHSFVIGTREEVEIRQEGTLIEECIYNYSDDNDTDIFSGGSKAEGHSMRGSDTDIMFIEKYVVVVYPGQAIPPDCTHKTVLYMREAENCRPGFVTLQLGHLGERGLNRTLFKAFVPDEHTIFVSSDIYRESWLKTQSDNTGLQFVSNGPAGAISLRNSAGDIVPAFHCVNWPRQANEWITRPRSYGWPTQNLIDKIVPGGCHIVPIGDKCSDDTHLQWRVSLIKAERRLVHSFSHIQFKVYGLLKYLLKQIKSTLQEIIGDDDILCSYFLKIVMFTAIENSHKVFWQEKNLFCCFWFCFNILIAWVKAGYCPNYFIPANNMFQRKIHGLSQLKLLQILHDIYQMKWKCLSVGTFFFSMWQLLCNTEVQSNLMYPTPQRLEINYDQNIAACIGTNSLMIKYTKMNVRKAFYLLSKSRSEFEEVLTYYCLITGLSSLAMADNPGHAVANDNKTRYRSMRKCKRWLTPKASLGTDLLYLATFHFQTGNYRNTLEMCGHVLTTVWYYAGKIMWTPREEDRYMQECCGHGYSLFYKLKNKFIYDIVMKSDNLELCPSHLHPERSKTPGDMFIPPLPYAAFLSFMCYNEIRDTKRRDAALRQLIAWTYDLLQGGNRHWIVYTMLGICYQTMGDNRRAIRSYWDSWQADTQWNPALERIAVVYLVMCYTILTASVQ